MVYSHIAHELKTLPKTLSYVAVEKTICMHIAMTTLYSDLVAERLRSRPQRGIGFSQTFVLVVLLFPTSPVMGTGQPLCFPRPHMCGWPSAAKPLPCAKVRGGVAAHGPIPIAGPPLPPPPTPADDVEAVYSDYGIGTDNFIPKEPPNHATPTTATPPFLPLSPQHPSCITGNTYNNTPTYKGTVAQSVFQPAWATGPHISHISYNLPYKISCPCLSSLSASLFFLVSVLLAARRRLRQHAATQLRCTPLRASIDGRRHASECRGLILGPPQPDLRALTGPAGAPPHTVWERVIHIHIIRLGIR